MTTTKKRTFENVSELLTHTFELRYFEPNDAGVIPIPHVWHKGASPLVLFLGDNASGKSFARRLVSARARERGVECMHISMQGRAGPDMTGGIRTLIYGSEAWMSTGENSIATVLAGINTCNSRTTPHVMFWDEPDIGLSDAWAAGVGSAIRDFAREAPKHTLGVFVVSHSKALVSQLLDSYPHVVFFAMESEAPRSIADWIEQPAIPRDIRTLGGMSHQRFLLIESILKDVRRKPSEPY